MSATVAAPTPARALTARPVLRPPDPAIQGPTLQYMANPPVASHDAVRRLAHLAARDAEGALDLTYGAGGCWRAPLPPGIALTTNDLDRSLPTDLHLDYRATGLRDGSFDLVVYDPPHTADNGEHGHFCARYRGAAKGNAALVEGVVAGAREAWRIVAAPSEVPEPSVLTFDAPARDRHVAFQAALEPRLGPNGDLFHVADWASKLTGLVARLAALLHLAALWDDPDPSRVPISLETVNGAITLGEYALGHALVAFGAMGADPSTEAARRIWQWIAEQGLTTVRRADLYQALRGTFPKSADLDAPLALLVEYGYLRPLAVAVDRRAEGRRGSQGRPPSATYAVNPLALAQAAENPGNAEKGLESGAQMDFRDFQRPETSANGEALRGRGSTKSATDAPPPLPLFDGPDIVVGEVMG